MQCQSSRVLKQEHLSLRTGYHRPPLGTYKSHSYQWVKKSSGTGDAHRNAGSGRKRPAGKGLRLPAAEWAGSERLAGLAFPGVPTVPASPAFSSPDRTGACPRGEPREPGEWPGSEEQGPPRGPKSGPGCDTGESVLGSGSCLRVGTGGGLTGGAARGGWPLGAGVGDGHPLGRGAPRVRKPRLSALPPQVPAGREALHAGSFPSACGKCRRPFQARARPRPRTCDRSPALPHSTAPPAPVQRRRLPDPASPGWTAFLYKHACPGVWRQCALALIRTSTGT